MSGSIKVGVLGLGTIGTTLADSVAKDGSFDLMVYDLREEPLRGFASKGVKTARSARELGEHADVVHVAVFDGTQLNNALSGREGLLEGIRPGSIILVHTTVQPEEIHKAAEAAQAKGAGLLDAQVTWDPTATDQPRLSFMVGGDPTILEQCRRVIEASGQHIIHMGGLGTGATAKNAQQIVVAGTVMAICEAMRLAERGNVNLESMAQLLHVSVSQSFIGDNWFNRFSKSVSPHGDGKLARSLLPALDEAERRSVPLPLTSLAVQLMRAGVSS